MCLGLEYPGAPARFHITRMVFQGRVFGHNTDDLIIDLVNPVTGQAAKHHITALKLALSGPTLKLAILVPSPIPGRPHEKSYR